VHSEDGPEHDLSAQVAKVNAKVKEKTRPWKSIIALILAIAAAIVSGWAHRGFRGYFDDRDVPHQIVAASAAVAFCVLGSIATYGLSGKARDVLAPRAGTSHAAVVRYAILLIGAFTTLIITLVLFDVPVGQLVVGGALTSVFVGIAAQQALGNVFAGIVLLLAHPFRVGDNIRLRAGAIGGQVDGIVTDIGITYVRLDTGGSVMSVPNSQVLNAIVGPVPKPPPDLAPPVPPESPSQAERPESPAQPAAQSSSQTSLANPGPPERPPV
jgi:small-conductance mechanosensitive channel